MNASHLNLIPAFSNSSDTYAIDFGRICGLVPAAPEREALEALADAVDAHRAVQAARRSSPRWRAASARFHTARRTYCALTGTSGPDFTAKVRSISECFTS